MTVPAPFAQRMAYRLAAVRVANWNLVGSSLARRLDSASPRQRKAIAVSGSVILHLCLVLLLLPSMSGLSASMGAVTGLGEVNGAGTGVTLIDISQLTPPKPPQTVTVVVTPEPRQDASPTRDTTSVSEDTAKPVEAKESATATEAASSTQATRVDSETPSDSATEVTAGAFGQNGEANLDLWNAIAPCWNRIANSATLPATLKITFDGNGGLALPPEIERDPDAPITDQSLKAEAQALQALAECGAYPMAEGQQGVVVKFPTPGQMPVGTPVNSGRMAAAMQ